MTKYTAEFELFWQKYPKRWVESSGSWVKIGKFEAFQIWKRLSKTDKQMIMAILGQVKANKYTPDAHRWLKKRRWEDYEVKKVANFDKKRPVYRKLSKTSEQIHSDEVR